MMKPHISGTFWETEELHRDGQLHFREEGRTASLGDAWNMAHRWLMLTLILWLWLPRLNMQYVIRLES